MIKSNKPAEQTLNQFSNALLKKTHTLQERFPQVLATLDSQDEHIQVRFKSLAEAFDTLNLESSRFKQDLMTSQFSQQKSEQLNKIDLKNNQWMNKIQKLSTQLEKYCTHLIQNTANLTSPEIEQHSLSPLTLLMAEFDHCQFLLKTTENTLLTELKAISDDHQPASPSMRLIS